MIQRLSFSIALIFSIFGSTLQAIETEAKQALLYDFDTGEILFEKNGDEVMTPSSMTKIMTAHLVLERIREGQLKYTDVLPISEKAWRGAYRGASTRRMTTAVALLLLLEQVMIWICGLAMPSRVKVGWAAATDRKSTRLNSSHTDISRMPSSA